MAAWALSVTGAVLLGVLADIVMAEGEIKKFIRGITAVAVLFVMIAPLPAILKGDGFHSPEIDSAPTVNEAYMQNLFAGRFQRLESRAEQALAEIGIENADVTVTFRVDSGDFSVEIIEVTVSLTEADIVGDGANIDNSVIVERVSRLVGADEKKVRVVR